MQRGARPWFQFQKQQRFSSATCWMLAGTGVTRPPPSFCTFFEPPRPTTNNKNKQPPRCELGLPEILDHAVELGVHFMSYPFQHQDMQLHRHLALG